ncbi:type VI secretion system-associated FHA domain protein TagH [Aquisalimonas sp.]|uniref:type VI secretion system-associated FHA domain protein TagH n=1 Tax=Aquisalimonas sp. TaxID=1872621 RepID=UPI0025B9A7AE|nr:type VI secretion system-associated FHA domain protein TagH [Aquisalimonas sp.]
MRLTLTVINEAASRLGANASCCWRERGGTLGRAENNDWTLPDPHMEISRCHGRVRYQQGEYFLEDTSANGIILADGITRMDPAEPRPLRDGDEFLIGDYRIRVRLGAEAPCAPPADTTDASGLAQEGSVADPLELFGGPVERPRESSPERQRGYSYLSEHFTPPRLSPSPQEPGRAPSSDDSSGEAGVLLPEDWWRDAPIAAPPRPNPGGRGEKPQAREAVTPTIGAEAAGDDTSAVSGQALRQLLAGAGLDPDQVPADKAEELGRILRVAVHGVMDLLRARMEIKNQFRMSVTLIQARENNPLKFSTNTEDALHNLLVKHNPDYMAPAEAFESSFEDLRFHQLALLAGMRTAFFEMLRQFRPDELERRFSEAAERSVLGRMTGPKCWDQYKAFFAEIDRDTEDYFNRLFGDAFVAAYEQQMRELKAAARRGDD